MVDSDLALHQTETIVESHPNTTPKLSFLRLLSGTASESLAKQALTDLVPPGYLDWLYFLVFNACAPIFEPRVLHYRFFAVYTILNVICNVGMGLYLRRWTHYVANTPNRAAYCFAFFKVVQNVFAACLTGWAFLCFGINPVTSLATLSLIAFAQGVIASMRASLPLSRLVLLCCLSPAVLVSAWIGGRPGYGTAGILLMDMVFLWLHGIKENREYWQALLQTRELMRSRRLATQNGARIGDALLTNAARHSAIVAERNRIAYEWHDTLLAGFSAISWQLEEARRRQSDSPASAADAIDLAANMLQHYRSEARLVVADLLVDDSACQDLLSLISNNASNATTTAGVEFKMDSFGTPVPMLPDMVRQLSRICDEAIANALRHAAPSSIKVHVTFAAKHVSFSVVDDGCGFDPSLVRPGHFGLHIMSQRAHRFGGDFHVESSLGAGTTVAIKIPYSSDFNMTPTRILVIEDQYFSRLALHTVIDRHSDMVIVGEGDTGQRGLALFEEFSPDVTIVDLKLPDLSGIEVIKAIRKNDPMARIVVLSNFEGSEYLHRATDAGAMAYLTKDASADELSAAIRAVRVGQSYIPSSLLHLLETRVAGNNLTLREQAVLDLLVLGWSNKQIGDHLGIVEKTVRIHMSSIFAKLGVANRTQAVLVALQRGFVDTPLDGKAESIFNESFPSPPDSTD